MVAVEYFGQLSGRRRRALRDELHRRLEWELPQHLRASDVAYRESADRVCVLLPNTTLDEAHRVGERLRSVLEAGSLPTLAALEIGVTLAGVSELSGRG